MSNPLQDCDLVLKDEGEYYSVICNTPAGEQFAAKNGHVKSSEDELFILRPDFRKLCIDAELGHITLFTF